MFDWVLNTPMQTDTFVNKWKERKLHPKFPF